MRTSKRLDRSFLRLVEQSLTEWWGEDDDALVPDGPGEPRPAGDPPRSRQRQAPRRTKQDSKVD